MIVHTVADHSGLASCFLFRELIYMFSGSRKASLLNWATGLAEGTKGNY